jgi:hypothetical protein
MHSHDRRRTLTVLRKGQLLIGVQNKISTLPYCFSHVITMLPSCHHTPAMLPYSCHPTPAMLHCSCLPCCTAHVCHAALLMSAVLHCSCHHIVAMLQLHHCCFVSYSSAMHVSLVWSGLVWSGLVWSDMPVRLAVLYMLYMRRLVLSISVTRSSCVAYRSEFLALGEP